MKKIVIILLTIVFCVSLLLSCTDAQPELTPVSVITAESSTPAPTMTPTTASTVSPILAPTSIPTTEATVNPTPKPAPKLTATPKPAPQVEAQAPAGIALVSITSPVNPGQTATITIQGAPNTKYGIAVIYKSGASTAAGLVTKTSNGSGKVSWSWKVGTRTTRGSWPIHISGGGQSFTTQIVV